MLSIKMSLKPCPECGHNYSSQAKSCPQCAAPNSDYESTSDRMFSGVNSLILFGALLGGVYFFGNPVLNYFNVGIVGAKDLKNCSNDRIKMQMLNTFNESPYALQTHIKAIKVQNEQAVDFSQDSALVCDVNLVLSNTESLDFRFDFKKDGDNYLIQGEPL